MDEFHEALGEMSTVVGFIVAVFILSFALIFFGAVFVYESMVEFHNLTAGLWTVPKLFAGVVLIFTGIRIVAYLFEKE